MTKFARAIGPETETDGVLEALIAGGTPPGKERGTNADDRQRHAYVGASRLAVRRGFPKALTHGRECCALGRIRFGANVRTCPNQNVKWHGSHRLLAQAARLLLKRHNCGPGLPILYGLTRNQLNGLNQSNDSLVSALDQLLLALGHTCQALICASMSVNSSRDQSGSAAIREQIHWHEKSIEHWIDKFQVQQNLTVFCQGGTHPGIVSTCAIRKIINCALSTVTPQRYNKATTRITAYLSALC